MRKSLYRESLGHTMKRQAAVCRAPGTCCRLRGDPEIPRNRHTRRRDARSLLSTFAARTSRNMDKDNKNAPARKPAEKKAPGMGSNVIWYLLALGIGTVFLVTLLASK